MEISRTVCVCIIIAVATLAASAGEQPQAFKVVEEFGVAYPDQIIDFDLKTPVKDPANTAMHGPDGSKVQCQIIENGAKVAVRTDLPANATKTWTLQPGEKPIVTADDVKVTEKGDFYEITNALIGVRIPRGLPGQEKLAPIQGVRYRNVTWTVT